MQDIPPSLLCSHTHTLFSALTSDTSAWSRQLHRHYRPLGPVLSVPYSWEVFKSASHAIILNVLTRRLTQAAMWLDCTQTKKEELRLTVRHTFYHLVSWYAIFAIFSHTQTNSVYHFSPHSLPHSSCWKRSLLHTLHPCLTSNLKVPII